MDPLSLSASSHNPDRPASGTWHWECLTAPHLQAPCNQQTIQGFTEGTLVTSGIVKCIIHMCVYIYIYTHRHMF